MTMTRLYFWKVTMHHEDLKAALKTAGWRIASSPISDALNKADWYAWMPSRESARNCCCNDRPPSVTLKPYQFTAHGTTHGSAEVHLTGELPSGHWVDLRVYSVPMAEVMDALPGAMDELQAAWVAAWDAAARAKEVE